MRKASNLPRKEFEKVPYIEHVPRDKRIIFLLPYYDEEKDDWFLYMSQDGEELMRVGGGESVLGKYYASEPEDSHDLPYVLGTLVTNYLSFPGITGAWSRLDNLIYQLATVLKQYEISLEQPKHSRLLLDNQLKYLLIVIRSFYDQLQKLIKNAAMTVVTMDEGDQERVIQDLPDSFARVVLNGEETVKEKNLIDKYGLPEPIADFYTNEASQFKLLREIRDKLVHHGEDLPSIFIKPYGAVVGIKVEPWSDFSFWETHHIKEENHKWGSLKAVFCYLVKDMLGMTQRFTEAFTSCVKVPPAIAPDCRIYLRHPFGNKLTNLDQCLSDPWEEDQIKTDD